MNWLEKWPSWLKNNQEELKKELEVHLWNIAAFEDKTREEVDAILLERINQEFHTSYQKISEITGTCLRKVLNWAKKYLKETTNTEK